MSATAEKTDPKLWETVKEEVTASDKGGHRGQWSARKAQLAVSAYKQEGGGYRGKRSADNHLQQWQDEEWGTKSGKESLATGERYLPKKAREALTDEEYRRTTAKKRADIKKGLQFSRQPDDVAEKAAPYRHHDGGDGARTKTALLAEARKHGIPGRSKMTKAQLEQALA